MLHRPAYPAEVRSDEAGVKEWGKVPDVEFIQD